MTTPTTFAEFKAALINTLLQCYLQPESKVQGQDMFGRVNLDGKSLKKQFNFLEFLAKKTLGESQMAQLREEVMTAYQDKLQHLMDRDEDLFKNQEIDDLNYQEEWNRFELFFLTENEEAAPDTAWASKKQEELSTLAVAEEAQARHDRMVARLAIMENINKMELSPEERSNLMAKVSDTLVERLMAGEGEWDESLKPFTYTKEDVQKQERSILRKSQAAYFRRKLEEKAKFLRELNHRVNQEPKNVALRELCLKLANKTKVWVELKDKNPKPYSKRALNALWNEAVEVLHDLGKFKQVFLRKEYQSETPCSFFMKETAEDMVEMKDGLHWAEEVRSLFYEMDDGCSRTPVRGGES